MSDTLQNVLARAEQQHDRQNGNVEFMPVLLKQTAMVMGLRQLSVWTHSSHSSRMIARIGDGQADLPTTAELEGVANGDVRPVSEVDSALDGTSRLWLSASSLGGDSRLFLLAEAGEKSIDQDDFSQLTDVFADLQRRRLLDSMLHATRGEAAWQSLIAQLHSSLDTRVTVNTIATDAAEILSCRRIAVGRRRGNSWEIVVTTGVSEPNDRSDASRQLTRWIELTAAGSDIDGEPFQRCVRPLGASRQWVDAAWAVVLEWDERQEHPQQLERFLKHASLALVNCQAARRRSLVGMMRHGLRSVRGFRFLTAAFIMGATAAALLLTKTELRIEVYGQLVPKERVFVFAPDDGTITELNVEDDSDVSHHDVLCVLTNEDLSVQLEMIEGQLSAAHARLAAIDALRGDRGLAPGEVLLLSAERAELEEKNKSLVKQSSIVAERLEQLEVRVGMEGRVYGDRLRQLLFQRPVQRGQYLFEVADPSVGWQLHLRVAESDVRYVLDASRNNQESPVISFALETSPEITRRTNLESLGATTDVDNSGELSTLVIADLTGPGFDDERPGAGVVARIHCGQRSVGFVWFRRVIEFVQRRVWIQNEGTES